MTRTVAMVTMAQQRPEGRQLFAPALLLGVVGTLVSALAGDHAWGAPDARPGTTLADKSGGHVPLAGALGLVGLACWGVLLVTRGPVRRLLALLGVLVAAGLVATAVVGRSSSLDSARHATVDLGQSSVGAHTTFWWYAALVAAILALLGAVLAVRHVRSWPEMGAKYDAPGAAAVQDPAEMEDVDLWRAIDEGHDPTADPTADPAQKDS
ncbi:MAG: Trp biosynthesis-associated membrane protein [Nocardioides sp.]